MGKRYSFENNVAIVSALLLNAVLAADPCKQHLSSCRNCLGDTENGCVMCRSEGLQQCLSPTDSLAAQCKGFAAFTPPLAEFVESIDACAAENSVAEKCASFSTENKVDCAGCLADPDCGWCAASLGSSGSGSCHVAASDGSAAVCSLLFSGGEFIKGTERAEEVCPTSEVPNYCPTYKDDCEACEADEACSTCIDYSSMGTCRQKVTCLPSGNAQRDCTDNSALFRPTLFDEIKSKAPTCKDIPSTCADFDALINGSGAAEESNEPASNTPADGDDVDTVKLPTAADSDEEDEDKSKEETKKSSANIVSLSVAALVASIVLA